MPGRASAVEDLVDRASALISAEDRVVLDRVDDALAAGRAMRDWWHAAETHGTYETQFTLATTFNDPDRAVGFFDRLPIGDRTLPVMGVVQEMRYDQGKGLPAERWGLEFREFLFRFFLRVTDYHEPQPFTDEPRTARAEYETGLSWCARQDERPVGFGYSQHYYKLASGAVGTFHRRDRFEILDLRTVMKHYAWIVLRVQIFGFNLTFEPFGPAGPALNFPFQAANDVMIEPAFVIDRTSPSGEVAAECGFGYAIIPRPDPQSPMAYGPGHFAAGYQEVLFRLLRTGEVRVRLGFLTNRPQRILKVDLAPFAWALDAADRLTFGMTRRFMRPVTPFLDAVRIPGIDPLRAYVDAMNWATDGVAARQWCIAWESLERQMLMQHFMEHYRMINGSLATWRRIGDWLDTAKLPDWIRTGRR